MSQKDKNKYAKHRNQDATKQLHKSSVVQTLALRPIIALGQLQDGQKNPSFLWFEIVLTFYGIAFSVFIKPVANVQ